MKSKMFFIWVGEGFTWTLLLLDYSADVGVTAGLCLVAGDVGSIAGFEGSLAKILGADALVLDTLAGAEGLTGDLGILFLEDTVHVGGTLLEEPLLVGEFVELGEEDLGWGGWSGMMDWWGTVGDRVDGQSLGGGVGGSGDGLIIVQVWDGNAADASGRSCGGNEDGGGATGRSTVGGGVILGADHGVVEAVDNVDPGPGLAEGAVLGCAAGRADLVELGGGIKVLIAGEAGERASVHSW